MTTTAAPSSADRRSRGWWIPWLIAGGAAVWLAVGHAYDFLIYWRAARMLRTGGWTAVYEIAVSTPFKYHPVFALAFLPFGWLPLSIAKAAWGLLNGAMIFDAQRRWRRKWRIDAVAIGVAFLCLAQAVLWQFLIGNVDFVMLWLWTVAATTPRRWVAATCYGVLIALKPFWLALILAWVLARRWGLIGRVLVVIGGLSIVPLVMGPASFLIAYQRWIATFVDPLHAHNYPDQTNQTWFALLYRHLDTLGHTGVLAWWIAGSAAVALLWMWGWRRAFRTPPPRDAWWQLELSLFPFILWTAPLSWIHQHLLLWPLLACAWQLARTEWSARVVVLASFVLLTGLSETFIGRGATVWVWRAGVEILAFPLLTWWAATRFSRSAVEPS